MAINKNKVMEAAQKFVEKGQVDKAIKEYLKIVDEDPKDVRVWLKIGDLYARKGSHSEATETYLKVAGFYREQGFYLKAVAVYKQVLKLDPRLVEVNLLLAEVYRQLGLMSDAMQQVELVAAFYLREGRSKEALSTIRELVDLDPENVATRIKLAELYSKEQMTAEATTEFAKAADQLRAHGRVEDFIKVAERLVWHQPDNHAMNRELAGLYLKRHDPRHALQKLQACFKGDSRDVETLSLLAAAFLALEQKAKTVSVWKELARIHQDNGQNSKAQDIFRKILSVQPDDAEALVATGRRPPLEAMPAPGSKAAGSTPAGQVRFSVPLSEPPRPAPPRRPPTIPPLPRRAGTTGRHSDEAMTPVVHVPPGVRPMPRGGSFETEENTEKTSMRSEAMREIELQVDEITGSGLGSPTTIDPGEAHAEEISKILTETDVYIKYGLQQKAIDHLQKIFALDPRNVEAREKLKDVYVSLGRTVAACAELEQLVGMTALPDPAQAEGYLSELAGFEGESTRARALADRHHLKLRPRRPSSRPSAPMPMPAPVLEEDEEDQTQAFHEVLVAGGDDLLEADPAGGDLNLDTPPLRSNATVGVATSEPGEVAIEVEGGMESSLDELGFDDLGLEAPANQPLVDLEGHGDDKTVEAALGDFESLSADALDAARELGIDPSDVALAESQGAPADDAAGTSLEDDLDEVDFFMAQDLHSEARVILRDLLGRYPDHPLIKAKVAELQAATAPVAGKSVATPMPAAPSKPMAGEGSGRRVFARPLGDEDAETHYDLGLAYKEMGLYEEAIKELRLVRETPGRAVSCHLMIGLCHAEQAKLEEAISEFKTGLYVEGISEREALAIYFELGAAYQAQGDTREALYYFEKVNKRDPRFRDVERRIEALSGPGNDARAAAPAAENDDADAAVDAALSGDTRAE